MREEDTVCVGSDGLQYCKVCGEAKEAFFPKGDFMGMKKHSRQCACDRKWNSIVSTRHITENRRRLWYCLHLYGFPE